MGSTSVVLDKATGELVERSTYQAYGGTESDYRPERWKSFREDYRFTGKEEDVEVGLIYFGYRFLNPLLNRWVSADPLTVHALGADPNLYAYVSGRVLQSTDPLGLANDRDITAEYKAQRGKLMKEGAAAQASETGWRNEYERRAYYESKGVMPAGEGFEHTAAAAQAEWASATARKAEIRSQVEALDASFAYFMSPVRVVFNGSAEVARRAGMRERIQQFDRTVAKINNGILTSVAVVGYALYREANGGRATPDELEAAADVGGALDSVVAVASTTRAVARASQARKGTASNGCAGGKCAGDSVCFVAGTPVWTEHGVAAIEDLRLGHRVWDHGVSCETPDLTGEWRAISLSMPNPDGSGDTLEVELLRPLSWLESQAVKVGVWLPLSLSELGVSGPAQVTAVEPAPTIEPGVGCVVMATVQHLSDEVLRILFVETAEVMGVTGAHLLFSAARGWIPARELEPGERLRTATGVVTIAEVQRVSSEPVRVYNVEIGVKHQYYVLGAKVLAHNQSVGGACPPAQRGSLAKPAVKGDPWSPPEVTKRVAAGANNNGPLAAKAAGFKKTNYRSHGQPVYTDGKRYISPDVDGHNGGAWKMADSPGKLGSKQTRMGTYDRELNRIGD